MGRRIRGERVMADDAIRFHEFTRTKTFLLKPKPDITPKEVLDIVLFLIASMNSSARLEGEITVHLDEDSLERFDANTLRHFEPEP